MTGIVMDCTTEELWLIPCRDFSKASRLDLVPTQPPTQMVPGHISPRVKWMDRKLITKPHHGPRWRMAGAPPPHLHMHSRCARDKFTSTPLLLYHKYGVHMAFTS